MANKEIQASEIKEIFMLFDKNSDGYVFTNELGTLIRAINLNPTETELVQLKNKLDPSNSGQFNLQQLENLVRIRGPDPDTLQDVIDALKVFDTDHDGKISVEEFVYAMVNMGERMTDSDVREIL
jgi:Ca2+-binding EF-hand superfamily protein